MAAGLSRICVGQTYVNAGISRWQHRSLNPAMIRAPPIGRLQAVDSPGKAAAKGEITMSMPVSGPAGGMESMHAMSGASYGAPPQQKMSNLFDSIDTSGSGSITKAQFTAAFDTHKPPAVFAKQGPDNVFATLDPNNTGSVSKSDFVAAMTKLMVSLRADPASAPHGPPPQDTLAGNFQALDQAASAVDPALGGNLNTKV